MTIPTVSACPVAALAFDVADLVASFTGADRSASHQKTRAAEAERQAAWNALQSTLQQATVQAPTDPTGALLQLDIAANAADELLDDLPGETMPSGGRTDLETIATVLAHLRTFIATAFPTSSNPADSYFAKP